MISDRARAKLYSDEKPLIKRNPCRSSTLAKYGWLCEGRGSRGFGYTPFHAWVKWERNHNLRMRTDAERYAGRTGTELRRVK